jgi:hypothetical protein
MTSTHIKLEIDPGQNKTAQGYKGQGIDTIEVDGNRLLVHGWYNESSPWEAEVELTDLQRRALRGEPMVEPEQTGPEEEPKDPRSALWQA